MFFDKEPIYLMKDNVTKMPTGQSENTERRTIQIATKAECEVLRYLTANTPDDQMVDLGFWDGDCWKSFFDKVVSPYAQKISENPWDVLAVFIAKISGGEFIVREDGTGIDYVQPGTR